MDSVIENVIALLEMHAGLSEIQSKQFLELAVRLYIGLDDRRLLKVMGKNGADTTVALRNSIEKSKTLG